MNIKKGDTVLVISGSNKGKRGEVLQVLPVENRVVVAGVNIRKRHLKPSKNQPRGGIVEAPAAFSRSNVMLIDPATDQPIRASKRSDAPVKSK